MGSEPHGGITHEEPPADPRPETPVERFTRVAFFIAGAAWIVGSLVAGVRPITLFIGLAFVYVSFQPTEKLREQLMFRGRPVPPLVPAAVALALSLGGVLVLATS